MSDALREHLALDFFRAAATPLHNCEITNEYSVVVRLRSNKHVVLLLIAPASLAVH